MSGAAIRCTGAVEVVLVPDAVTAPERLQPLVDAIWDSERRVRPLLVDGAILSVEEIDGNRVTVRPCPYRLFVARERDAHVRSALRVRALGTSGVVLVGADDAVRVVLGRRSVDVTEYPSAWELVPSGGLDPARAGEDGVIDVLGALLEELDEEIGVPPTHVSLTIPLGLVHDQAQDGYDVCFALRVPEASIRKMPEYAETLVLPVTEAAARFGAGSAEAVVPTSRAILELAVEAGLL